MPAMHTDNISDSPVNISHIRQLATKWRRQVTNAELLELIDYVLGENECPRCRDLRLANRRRVAEHKARKKARAC